MQEPVLLGCRTLPVSTIANSAAVHQELDRRSADSMLAWAPIYDLIGINAIKLDDEVRGWSDKQQRGGACAVAQASCRA